MVAGGNHSQAPHTSKIPEPTPPPSPNPTPKPHTHPHPHTPCTACQPLQHNQMHQVTLKNTRSPMHSMDRPPSKGGQWSLGTTSSPFFRVLPARPPGRPRPPCRQYDMRHEWVVDKVSASLLEPAFLLHRMIAIQGPGGPSPSLQTPTAGATGCSPVPAPAAPLPQGPSESLQSLAHPIPDHTHCHKGTMPCDPAPTGPSPALRLSAARSSASTD